MELKPHFSRRPIGSSFGRNGLALTMISTATSRLPQSAPAPHPIRFVIVGRIVQDLLDAPEDRPPHQRYATLDAQQAKLTGVLLLSRRRP